MLGWNERRFKCIQHGIWNFAHILVNDDSQEQNDQTKENWKQHFILFSLLDALFPDVELKRCLLSGASISKGHNILEESLVDTLEIIGFHQEEALECLTEIECTGINRILSFIYQIEHFDNNRMFQKLLHIHFKHDVQRVFSLCHVEDWLTHELW